MPRRQKPVVRESVKDMAPGSQFRTFDDLERHLTTKINSIETNLSDKIAAVEDSLTGKIQSVEKYFTAENKAAKDAISIAMTAADRAAQKSESAADERTRSIMARLDKIEQNLAKTGGWSEGIASSLVTIFQIISSLGVIGGLIALLIERH